MDWSLSLRLIAPEQILVIGALVLLLVSAWAGDKASRLACNISVGLLIVAGACVAPALWAGASGVETEAFFGQFRADAFASFAKLLIYIGAAATLLVAPAWFDRIRAMRAEFPVLVLLAVVGMSIMVSATNLITLYIGLELNSLAAYVLAAFIRNDDRSAEAGIKYFVLGALASGILLFGISFVYGFTGTTSFAGVRDALADTSSLGVIFGITFVLVGLAFKISAVPFHMWTPDVYEGAPTPVTTFFATAPKVAALALLMRVTLYAFIPQFGAWQQIVVFVALASIVVGALGAIGQDNIKRLLAYSSINNVGFLLIGLATGTVQGASAMLVYMAIYIPMSIAGFMVVLMLRDAEGKPVESIKDMAGLSRTHPLLALGLAATMFSLAGIPPLFGFWGKFVVFQAAVSADLLALAAIGIAASVIGAFYYIKVVKVLYFDEPAGIVVREKNTLETVLLVLSVLAISPLGYLFTKCLNELSTNAASALFVG